MDATLEKVDQLFLKKDPSDVRVGDTVRALIKIKEGTRERTQVFSGVVIAIKGTSVGRNVKIRKISYGVGVEKTIPLHSPVLEGLEIVKRGKPRRAKLFYLRKRVGKMAVYVRPLKQVGEITDNSKAGRGKAKAEVAKKSDEVAEKSSVKPPENSPEKSSEKSSEKPKSE